MVSSSARNGVPPPLTRTDVWPLCLPVKKQQRVGAQTDEPANRLLKRIPAAAMRSRLGVRMFGLPMYETS
jgi:hypothetical protein